MGHTQTDDAYPAGERGGGIAARAKVGSHIKRRAARTAMHRLSTVREVFAHFRMRKKLYMLPVLLLLITLMGLTVMAQSGLAAFVYPI